MLSCSGSLALKRKEIIRSRKSVVVTSLWLDLCWGRFTSALHKKHKQRVKFALANDEHVVNATWLGVCSWFFFSFGIFFCNLPQLKLLAVIEWLMIEWMNECNLALLWAMRERSETWLKMVNSVSHVLLNCLFLMKKKMAITKCNLTVKVGLLWQNLKLMNWCDWVFQCGFSKVGVQALRPCVFFFFYFICPWLSLNSFSWFFISNRIMFPTLKLNPWIGIVSWHFFPFFFPILYFQSSVSKVSRTAKKIVSIWYEIV